MQKSTSNSLVEDSNNLQHDESTKDSIRASDNLELITQTQKTFSDILI